MRLRLIAAVVLGVAAGAHGQDAASGFPVPVAQLGTTIECIAGLESQRDAKCYATASRLEDFIYGTPLEDDARFEKIELQKRLIRAVWEEAAQRAHALDADGIGVETLAPVLNAWLPGETNAGGDHIIHIADGDAVVIRKRDVRQYGSVAYALRAILAVQQENLFLSDAALLPLDTPATEEMKRFTDLFTLAVLRIADDAARLGDRNTIDAAALRAAWAKVAGARANTKAPPLPEFSAADHPAPFVLTRNVIAQKIASYEAYNKISLPVFLRNIQVYFARHRWAEDPEASEALKKILTETLIGYTVDLINGADAVAEARGDALIRVTDLSAYAKVFIPHRLNEYEDAIFFPNLPPQERITIESYDMDAFRDSGLHWQYLNAALDEPALKAVREPDPFALELIVENVAQLGVLLMRIAGDVATERGEERLAPDHFIESLRRIEALVARNNATTPAAVEPAPVASATVANPAESAMPYFTEVTKESGIVFTHRSADWLNRLIRSFAVRNNAVAVLAVPPAFGGSGAAAEDLNGDGLPDLLLLSGLGNRLYFNAGNGHFRDGTADAGISWRREDGYPGEPRQPIIADFDNDGLQDIFISYVNDSHRLYRNLGDGRFEDVSAAAGLGGAGLVGGPATAFDFDRDGLLDLYISYFGQYTEGILPTLARRNENGLPNQLFRNVGGMRFEDVSAGSGTAGKGWTQAVAHTDFDNDGWQDLIEGNDFGVNAYYRNLGNGTFENVAESLGTGKPSFTMSVGIGDLNRDRLPDIYISNIVTMDKDQKYVNPSSDTPQKFDAATMAEMRVVEANDLFLSNAAGGEGTRYVLSDKVGRGRSSTGWAWGADFFDADNDGDDDLYVANGMNEFAVYSTEHPYYKDPEGNERDVLFPESSRETNVLFVNEDGKLNNVSQGSGADLLGNSRAVVYLDADNDGDLDMVLNNYHEPAVVYRNNAEARGNHWLKIRLVGDPMQKTTRDAIGARIILRTAEGGQVWREIHGGSGYLTMHPKTQHFGLGTAREASATIYWPDGTEQQIDRLEADTTHTIRQPSLDLAKTR